MLFLSPRFGKKENRCGAVGWEKPAGNVHCEEQ
jgi:hypothetical protein